MLQAPCPRCSRINTASAQSCVGCGTRLGPGGPGPQPPGRTVRPASAGALWLDDLGTAAPAKVAPARPAAPPHPPANPALTPPQPQRVPDEATARAVKKAAKRAEVRRLRRRDTSAAGGTAPSTPEVLVLDADETAGDTLCSLLRDFGFTVHATADVAEAAMLATTRPLVAIFVDLALRSDDGGDGIDLCKFILDAGWLHGDAESALVLVAAQLRPMDRVRAQLAGCAAALLKPTSRGAVAGVLDDRGIALPSDARRLGTRADLSS